MKQVLLVVVAVAAAHALAFREAYAGTLTFFLILAVTYAALAGLALRHFAREGTLRERLAPKWGDLSLGALSAMVLLMVSWLGRSALAPAGTPRQAWLYRIYLQLGDPDALQQGALFTAALLFIPLCEELVWRGLILERVSERFGTRRGWIIASVIYAVALLPTAYTLRDPSAGLNPLLPTAALGAGLVWNFMAGRFARLPPVMISHMAFTYFSAVQFRWPGT